MNCLDIGASTGGFTQVLLERGAQKVIALDVGTDQLAPEIKQDSRVIELSETNIRDVNPSELPINPTEIGLVVVDLSFISLRIVVGQIISCAPSAEFVFLIKPQFELQKNDLNRQGVVVDSAARIRGLQSALEGLSSAGMRVLGLVESKTVGSTGNIEYLAHLRVGEPSNWQTLVAQLA
jgi:23S rRNA (cytidine1920-2'-O)/16S rRNA (cytidine1409-2'-O)-methyltransferase